MDNITFIEQCGVPCYRFDLVTDGTPGVPWVANQLTQIKLPRGRVIRVQISNGEQVGETALGVVAADGTIIGQTAFGASGLIAFAS